MYRHHSWDKEGPSEKQNQLSVVRLSERNVRSNKTMEHSAGSCKLLWSYPALEQEIVKLDLWVTQPKVVSYAEGQGVFF